MSKYLFALFSVTSLWATHPENDEPLPDYSESQSEEELIKNAQDLAELIEEMGAEEDLSEYFED